MAYIPKPRTIDDYVISSDGITAIDRSITYYPNNSNGIFSAPDYEKPLDKMKWTMKLAAGVTTIFGTIYACQSPDALRKHVGLGRLIKFGFPIAGLGFFFTGGTIIAANLRKKNDVFNNIIGVFTTVPIVRKFLPVRHTVSAISTAAVLIVLVREMNLVGTPTMDEYLMSNNDAGISWYKWSQAKPASEPYMKRKSEDLFTILQAE